MLNFITGGVCAAQGFRAGGIHVGVKTHAAWKKDVALIVSDEGLRLRRCVYEKRREGRPHPCGQAPSGGRKGPAAVINSGNANAAPPWERKTRSGSARRQARPWAAGRRMWW